MGVVYRKSIAVWAFTHDTSTLNENSTYKIDLKTAVSIVLFLKMWLSLCQLLLPWNVCEGACVFYRNDVFWNVKCSLCDVNSTNYTNYCFLFSACDQCRFYCTCRNRRYHTSGGSRYQIYEINCIEGKLKTSIWNTVIFAAWF